MKYKSNKQKGYTIIETMISISVFLVIVMAGMGALLNANLLHKKSADMRSIMDSLNFIMEDMSRNLRTGYNYHCWQNETGATPNNISDPQSCDDGWGIAFEHQEGNLSDNGDQWAYYVDVDNRIQKSTDGAASFIPITPEEVEINTQSGFVVSGAESDDDRQPMVTIRMFGTITLKNTNVKTPFSLQTTVSQRLVDI